MAKELKNYLKSELIVMLEAEREVVKEVKRKADEYYSDLSKVKKDVDELSAITKGFEEDIDGLNKIILRNENTNQDLRQTIASKSDKIDRMVHSVTESRQAQVRLMADVENLTNKVEFWKRSDAASTARAATLGAKITQFNELVWWKRIITAIQKC